MNLLVGGETSTKKNNCRRKVMEKKRYGLYSKGSSGWTSMRNEEFQEGDVWEVLQKVKDSDLRISCSNGMAKRIPTEPKMVPKYATSPISVQSAPVRIPDWSKIYGTSFKNASSSWLDNDDDGFRGSSWESEDGDQVDADVDVVPPHEWTARSHTSSFSVCEGVGRTLKGRDLSRVRNAVLSKTGFLEPKSDYY